MAELIRQRFQIGRDLNVEFRCPPLRPGICELVAEWDPIRPVWMTPAQDARLTAALKQFVGALLEEYDPEGGHAVLVAALPDDPDVI